MGKKGITLLDEICLDRDVLQRKIEVLQKELEELNRLIEELKMKRNYVKSELRKARMRLEELDRVCR